MKGFDKAHRSHDRAITEPKVQFHRESEYAAPEFAPPGVKVICSVKYIKVEVSSDNLCLERLCG